MGSVSDEVRDPIVTALALARGQLLHLDGSRSQAAMFEAADLELEASDDLRGVATMQALFSAHLALKLASFTEGQVSAEQVLTMGERAVREATT